jgi:hypothetical protein
MTRSETIGSLAAALAKAQGAMRNAAKDARNPHFNSRYADLAAIVDAQREPLAANELSVIQIPSTPEPGTVALTSVLLHSSGEWLQSDELRVSARDAGPQAVGSCLTYLRRYQLAALVGIAAEDDDGEAGERRPRLVETRTMGDSDLAVADDPPPGFYYVSGYTFNAPWHEAALPGWSADGGSLVVSTKLPATGKMLAKAAELGLAIKPDITPKKDRKGEAYLNSVQFYDAAQPDEPGR